MDEGRPALDPARELAVAVLAQEPPLSACWRAAVEVLEGAALRVRRGVLLAGMILEEPPEEER